MHTSSSVVLSTSFFSCLRVETSEGNIRVNVIYGLSTFRKTSWMQQRRSVRGDVRATSMRTGDAMIPFAATPLEVVIALIAFTTLAGAIALYLYWDWRDEQDGDVAI